MENRITLSFFILMIVVSVTSGHPRRIPESFSVDKTRIVGGHEATPNSFPYQAYFSIFDPIDESTDFMCGAVLIHPQWVVTASHCTGVLEGQKVVVTLGAHRRTQKGATVQEFTMEKSAIIDHEQYSIPTDYENDIALIKLSKPATVTAAVKPIGLSKSDPPAGTVVTASGWGLTSDDAKDGPDKLYTVDIPVITNEECGQYYDDLKDTVICTSAKGGKGICSGDSGGPLANKEKTKLLGITSFGSYSCVAEEAPHAFTRISKYIDWIKAKTGINF